MDPDHDEWLGWCLHNFMWNTIHGVILTQGNMMGNWPKRSVFCIIIIILQNCLCIKRGISVYFHGLRRLLGEARMEALTTDLEDFENSETASFLGCYLISSSPFTIFH